MSILGRIREGLARTKQQIVEQFEEIVLGADAPEKRTRSLDVDTLDALEELLISADLGMAASANVSRAMEPACAIWSSAKSGASSTRLMCLLS